MTLPNKISELRDPNTLKTGHVSKLSKGRNVVVKRDKYGKAKYVKASPKDVKCSRTLKKNVKQMLDEAKTKKNKRVKSYSQALAIAYSKTKKQYPKCGLVQQSMNKTTKSKTKKLLKNKKRKLLQNGGGKRVRLQKKIVKLLIKKGYILKQEQPNICSPIIGDAIKKLYNKKNNIKGFSKEIRNKSKKYTLTDLLSNINSLIKQCSNNKTSYPENINEYDSGFRYSNSSKNITFNSSNSSTIRELEKIKSLYKFVQKLP